MIDVLQKLFIFKILDFKLRQFLFILLITSTMLPLEKDKFLEIIFFSNLFSEKMFSAAMKLHF